MTTQVILPRIPSQLIRLALADLKKVEAMPDKYKVEMWEWHEPTISKKCVVCLAGSVMACTLNMNINKSYGPSDFPENAVQLFVLDCFRNGNICAGLWRLGIDIEYENRTICYYDRSPANFHADMNNLADDLEKDGL